MHRDARIALAAVAAFWPCSLIHAQQLTGAPPAAVPQLNSDMFKIPYETPTYDVGQQPATPGRGKLDLGKADDGKTQPKVVIPNKVDLGNYKLELNVRHDDDRTRAGLDSGETANINSTLGAPKQSPAPNYFGLKLSTPTH